MRRAGALVPVLIRFPNRLLDVVESSRELRGYSWGGRAFRTDTVLQLIADELSVDVRTGAPLDREGLRRREERRTERAERRAASAKHARVAKAARS